MEKNLVSVIIPIYNVEAYLKKCVDSVLCQTYSNLEIILVNDGSTDGCLNICREYEKIDARIRVVDKKNGGLSDARNAGMKIATGKYYYFLDSDDYIKNDLIEKCVDAMETSNADMVVFNFEHVSEEGRTWVTDTFPKQFYPLKKEQDRIRFFAHIFFEYKCGFEAWNRMYRASVIQKNQLKYAPNKLVFAEDICFNLGFLCCAGSVKVIEDRLYYYLHRGTSIMGLASKKVQIMNYVNIGMYNHHMLKKNANTDMQKYFYMIYALMIERAMQNESFEERYRQIQKLPESQKEFHAAMLHRFQKEVFLLMKMIGLKKTVKIWMNHWYYLTGNKILKAFLQKIEMEL